MIGMEPVLMEDLERYCFLSKLTGNHNADHPVFVCVAGRMDKEANCYRYTLKMNKNGEWRTVCELEKPGVLLFLDADTLLLSGVKSTDAPVQPNSAQTRFSTSLCSTEEWKETFTLPLKTTDVQRLTKTQLLIKAEIQLEAADAYALDPEQAEAWQKTQRENADYTVLEELPWCADGRGVIQGKRMRLFVYDTLTTELFPLTDPRMNCGSVSTCPELGKALFTGMTYGRKASQREGLYCFDAQTGSVTTLIEEGVYRRIKEPRFVSGTVVFAATDGLRYGKNESLNFYTLNPDTGAVTLLAKLDDPLGSSIVTDCRLSSGSAVKTDGTSLYFTMNQGWTTPLFQLDLKGNLRRVLDFNGSIDDFDVTGQTVRFIGQRAHRLQEIEQAQLPQGKLTSLTDWNADALADRDVIQPRYLSFHSGGRQIDGWVLTPWHYDPNQRYPAVLEIHGGPNTAYGEVFHHEMQMLAGKGYFVLFCNPVGSVGRGNAFADIRGRYGCEDYQNLTDFLDEAIQAYPAIDPKRIAVSGGSYGGFMVNWMIGHTHRFACAISQRSIANFMTIYGLSDFGYYFVRDQLSADPLNEQDQARLWRHSPLRYAGQVKTPTLFLHSEDDHRCSISEGLQMFTALSDRGVPTRMVCFKGEHHELSRSGKPLHRLRRLAEIQRWLDCYCPANGSSEAVFSGKEGR